MGKRLTITYGDNVIFDEAPEQFRWSESGGTIKVEAGPLQVNPLNQLAQALGSQRKQLPQ